MSKTAESNSRMPTRTLGRTGVEVSLIGLGGWHLGFDYIDEELSIRIIRTAIDNGINFMDNCWDYNDGASELRMGKALRDGYRERAFLMTKIDGRTKEAASKQLDESLKRLQTDHIDLVQHHEILRYEDPHRKVELFKTTSIYDGTAVHPEWLGEEPQEVQRVMQTG